ncbi:MAG: alpha/beta hydrolase family protein [Planctomycetaceae bacterium]|nr:alpha/beta hydrolase family protein [Planctomycetaceae bacterium]
MTENPTSPHPSSNWSSPKHVWRRLWSNAVDEFFGLMILRMILWYRRHPPAKIGHFYDSFPGLLSGELTEFFHPLPHEVELSERRQLRQEHDDHTIWDLEFPSLISTNAGGNDIVRARWWSGNEGPTKRCVVGADGVVQVHAHWFRQLAEHLNPAGIDVVMMDAPFNFRRTPKGYRPGQLILNGDLEHQLAVSRHAILDLWTLVENLQREGYEVGLVGVSFGGWMALMTSLLAKDLAFVTAVGPPVDMERLLDEGGTIVRAVRRGLGPGPLPEDTIRQAVRAVTPMHWSPLLDPQRIHLHAATFDRFVPTARIRELADRWQTKFTPHPAGHMALTQKSQYIQQVADEIRTLW